MEFLQSIAYIEESYRDLEAKMMDPEISQDTTRMIALHKELKRMERPFQLYQQLRQCVADKADAKATIDQERDPDTLELAKEQLHQAVEDEERLMQEIKLALLPSDPNDDKNIFLEVRPAAGGDEAGLFAEEVLRMYLRYAERQSFKTEIVEHDMSDI